MAHAAILLIAFAAQWLSATGFLLIIAWLQHRISGKPSTLFVCLYWLTLPVSLIIGLGAGLEAMLLMETPPNFGPSDNGYILPYVLIGFIVTLANGAGGKALLVKGRSPWLLSKFKYLISRPHRSGD